ncbi:MAG TPA: hypothetical protein DCK95_11830 [Anaerolineaceae bacterium]|uniref:Corrinoid adenosyltransferase n=1 Tax=Anaerolinea thermophila TaxID=167964 RepID=A0A101FXU4_9CHLR|nr:MAG: Cobalamin adenosyltransferase [Anaerolinea thermophila]HAF62996.1 hypothetical protein [Anaerolineaceae bacterium]
MSVFSGRGDEGFTDTLGGLRVRKDHPMIDLIGEIDELSAWIGLARSEEQNPSISEILPQIQIDLSILMSVLSSCLSDNSVSRSQNIPNSKKIADWITVQEKDIQVPNAFLQSGSTKLGALYNVLRAITRRVERKAVAALPQDASISAEMLAYLNRLSTLFYILWLRADQLH